MFDGSDSGPATIRVSSQAGPAFAGEATLVDDGFSAATTNLAFSGTVDTRGHLGGAYTLQVTSLDHVIVHSAGSFSGSVFGSALAGTFAGPATIVTGDTCQLAGTLNPL